MFTKTRRILGLVLILALLTVWESAFVSADQIGNETIVFEKTADPRQVTVEADINKGIAYDLKTWYAEDENDNSMRYIYVFLPADVNLSKVTLSFSDGTNETLDLRKEVVCRLCSSESNGRFWKYRIVAMQAELPTMYLNINEKLGTIRAMNSSGNHSVYCHGEMRLDVPASLVKSKKWTASVTETMEIRGRGNASWGLAKKPYQFQLDTAQNLLGMGASKTWCLIANHCDRTLVRNKLALDFAASIGLAYSSKSEFINVFMNGEYLGCYQLTEKVQIGENRVDVADKDKQGQGDKTGGYLLENDIYARTDRAQYYFPSEFSNYYVVRDPDAVSKGDLQWLDDYMYDIESAILQPKNENYTKNFDVTSSLLVYWVNEVFKNGDYGLGSTYYYKDVDKKDSKLYSGPVWDFDCSLGAITANRGSADRNENSRTYQQQIFEYRIENMASPTGWWLRPTDGFTLEDISETIQYYLFQHGSYVTANRNIYTQKVKKAMLELPAKMEALVKQVGAAADMNFKRWAVLTSPHEWGNRTSIVADTYEEEVAYLRNYLTERVRWIDSAMTAEIAAAAKTKTNAATSVTTEITAESTAPAVTTTRDPNRTYASVTLFPEGWNTTNEPNIRVEGTQVYIEYDPDMEGYCVEGIIYRYRTLTEVPVWMWVIPIGFLVIALIIAILMIRASRKALKMPNPFAADKSEQPKPIETSFQSPIDDDVIIIPEEKEE